MISINVVDIGIRGGLSLKRVIVGVPVYKTNLYNFEKIALAQLIKMLGNYEIVFIAPESLKITNDNNILR